MADVQQLMQQVQQMLDAGLLNLGNGVQQRLNQLAEQIAPLVAAQNAQQQQAQQQNPMPVDAPVADAPTAVNIDPRALNKPSKFSGKLAEVRTFVDSLEDYIRVLNISLDSNAAVVLAASYLDGPARQWWSYAKDSVSTFSEFRSQILKRFVPVDEAQEARFMLQRLHQKGSAKEYTDRFNATILPLRNSNPDDLIFAYLNGLKEQVRQHVRAARPRTLEDAMELAVSLDRDLWQSHQHRHMFQPARTYYRPASRYQPAPASEATPMELGAIATGRPVGKVDNRQRQLVCWRCGKPGHKMASCKMKGLRQSAN